jgi:hypothetical protein
MLGSPFIRINVKNKEIGLSDVGLEYVLRLAEVLVEEALAKSASGVGAKHLDDLELGTANALRAD